MVIPSTLLGLRRRRLHRVAEWLIDDVVDHRDELGDVVGARCLRDTGLAAPLLAVCLAGMEQRLGGPDLLCRGERAADLALDRALAECVQVVLLHPGGHVVGDAVLHGRQGDRVLGARHARSHERQLGQRGHSRRSTEQLLDRGRIAEVVARAAEDAEQHHRGQQLLAALLLLLGRTNLGLGRLQEVLHRECRRVARFRERREPVRTSAARERGPEQVWAGDAGAGAGAGAATAGGGGGGTVETCGGEVSRCNGGAN